jgi:hypothetical protein
LKSFEISLSSQGEINNMINHGKEIGGL